MDFEKMIWDMAEFNASVIAKEHEERTKNRCPYCGGKTKLKLVFDHSDEYDSGQYAEFCENNCFDNGDFDRN